MSLPALACFAALLACGARAPTAEAQPSIRIRAESRIELHASWSGGRLLLRGYLRDDLGVPIAEAPLELRVQARAGGSIVRRSVRSRQDGTIEATLDAAPGSYRLSAAYAGDPHHERVEVERDIDASRAEVRLRVQVPDEGRLRLDVPAHEIVVRAESEATSGGLRIRLSDELGRELGAAETNPLGEVRFRVLATQLGPPSAGRLMASVEADATHADALTEVPVLRIAPTRLSLTVSDQRPVRGTAIRARGRLVDFAGRALGREAVVLVAAGAPLITTLTAGDGRFDVRVVPPREGSTTLVARFESDAPWRLPGESAPVSLEVGAPGRAKTGWVLATLAATAALLVAFGIRTRRDRPRAPRRTEHAPKSGVEFGARRFRAARLAVEGVVVSLRDGSPLSGARVSLRAVGHDDAPFRCISDSLGRFSVTPGGAGPCVLEVHADEHESLLLAVTLPHRGEWSAAIVKLERRRDRALDALAPIAEALLPERAAGTTTPREVRDAALARSLSSEVATTLTDGVERAGYAATPPSQDDLLAVERARDALLAVVRRKPAGHDERR